jgi:GT2 family glycosyltransferase
MRLRPDGPVGVVIPVCGTTPAWQLRECVASIFEGQHEEHEPYLDIHVIVSIGPCGPDQGKALPTTYLPNLGGEAAWKPLRTGLHVVNGARGSFAANANRGIEAARELGCRAVLLLNADTHLAPHQLERWVSHLSTQEDLAVCGCISNEIGGPARREYGEDTIFVRAETAALETKDWTTSYSYAEPETKTAGSFCLKEIFLSAAKEALEQPRARLHDVDHVKMVAAMIPAWAFEQVGLLDSRFRPGNREDVDWCWRARQAGFRTAFAYDLFVHHYGSQSFGNEKAWRKAMRDNAGRFNAKWAHTTRFGIEQAGEGLPLRTDRILDLMVTEEPFSMDPLWWRGQALQAINPRSALRDLRAYLGFHKRDEAAWSALCVALAHLGRFNEARLIVTNRCMEWFPHLKRDLEILLNQIAAMEEGYERTRAAREA